jgi:hypothetical protein
MIASPMNFSTAPPWSSRIVCIASKYRCRISRSVSESIDSPRLVEPTRSLKTTVTVFRTSCGA